MVSDEVVRGLIARGLSPEQVRAIVDRENSRQAPAQELPTPTPQDVLERPIAESVASQPRRETPTNSETPLEFNGILDNPIARGIGTGLDFLGGAVRTGLASAVDPFVDAQLTAPGDFIDAINPIDNKDAITSAELIRRATGTNPQSGQIEGSDLAGFALDTLTDPLTYATLGVLPAVRGINAALRAPTAAAARAGTATSRAATKGVGLLSGRSGDILDNFIDNSAEFKQLNKNRTQFNRRFDSAIADVDKGAAKIRKQEQGRFSKAISSKKEVDIKDFKDSLKSIRDDIGGGLELNDAGAQASGEISKLVDSILGKTSTIDGQKVITELPDKITGTQADKLHKSIQPFLQSTGNETSVEKLLKGGLQSAAVDLRQKAVGKNLARQYKKRVIDLGDDIASTFGERGDSALKRRKKTQNTFKSGSRADNIALQSGLDDIGNAAGRDLNQDALDFRTLDILNSSTGRLREAFTQGNPFRAAANIVIDPLFRGATNVNNLNNRVLNNETLQGLNSVLVNRILAGQNQD